MARAVRDRQASASGASQNGNKAMFIKLVDDAQRHAHGCGARQQEKLT